MFKNLKVVRVYDSENIDKNLDTEYREYPALSQSTISSYLLSPSGHPELLEAFLSGNLPAKEPTSAMKFGTMIHDFMYDKDNFYVSDIEKPTPKNEEWVMHLLEMYPGDADLEAVDIIQCAIQNGIHKNIKNEEKLLEKYVSECQEYQHFLITSSNYEYVITSQEREKLELIKNKIQFERPELFVDLPETKKEFGIVVSADFQSSFKENGEGEREEEEGEDNNSEDIIHSLQIKGKIDRLEYDVNYEEQIVNAKIIDFKTIGTSTSSFPYGFCSNNYDVQTYIYSLLVHTYLSELFPNFEIRLVIEFIAIGTQFPYSIQKYTVPNRWKEYAEKRIYPDLMSYFKWIDSDKDSKVLDRPIPFVPKFYDYYLYNGSKK